MSEPEHLGGKRAESARLRRAEQLRRWKGSLTEQEPVVAGGGRGRHRGAGGSRVRFEEGAVFLAACSSGDTEEVKRLLGRGARINTTNVDGLTALHQCEMGMDTGMDRGQDNELPCQCFQPSVYQLMVVVVVAASGLQQLLNHFQNSSKGSDDTNLTGKGSGRENPLKPQACIDENLDMVKFLVENGANVNQQDNEGWTPLHAVASCGYLNIAEYLISHGANVAAVNSEGEVPSDIAEEAAMKDLLLEQVKKQGVDLDLSRKEEEQQMLQDARQWLNSGRIEDVKQPRTGATALHVAAAKGYSEVMRLLIQAGFNLNVQDNDGWTPLHAAAHWGVKEACSILAEALCDMDIRNKLGQTPFDVADEGLVEHLEMLQKKQTVLRSEKETRNKLIDADMNGKPQSRLFTNKEKILYEEDTLKSMEMEEENKDSSSSSSEEEEEAEVSESDAEKESERKEEPFANHSSRESRPSITEQMPPPEPNSFTASARRFSWLGRAEEQRDESPAAWRLGLRKTGSHNTLSDVAVTREAQRDKAASIYRSSSSPRISALLDNKEKDKDSKSYLATIAPRRLSSTSDTEEKENRESAVTLVRSGSYTRQPWRDEPKGHEAPHPAAPTTYVSTYLKRAPFRHQTDSAVEKSPEGNCVPPLGVITNRAVLGAANGTATALGKDLSAEEARERRRSFRLGSFAIESRRVAKRYYQCPVRLCKRTESYLTPVRDEEAESLRKARSRQARQTRRSTQGVTLTDLQEAERTFSRSRAERQAQEQQSDKAESAEPEDSERQESRGRWSRTADEESVYRRLRCPAQPDKPTTPVSPSTAAPLLYTTSYLTRTNKYLGLDSVNPADFRGAATEMEKNECEDQDSDDRSLNKQSIRERRRPKERRRGTGIIFSTKDDDDEVDGNEDVKETRAGPSSKLALGELHGQLWSLEGEQQSRAELSGPGASGAWPSNVLGQICDLRSQNHPDTTILHKSKNLESLEGHDRPRLSQGEMVLAKLPSSLKPVTAKYQQEFHLGEASEDESNRVSADRDQWLQFGMQHLEDADQD
ncbi:Protein phosphatase 1 regulatory subunit 12B [Willisornis vidua]|uniref:Protein phosphatase 1 regulatory subunit n=1 Tax=Willisornis vidua TaxID=1566151 RepID=A0ABQ9DRR5_9PASS|nr:Protein phosphatase 1 regulatory subunit 12B [Willisornis vidua]